MRGAIPVVKGHGTENDFVLLPDADGTLEISDNLVRALCDRRAGLGGDGIIRVVRAAALAEAASQAGEAEWFMDYRNADGSVAQMCGNGVRVFVSYLRRAGLVKLQDGEEISIATRAGVKRVRREGALLCADLGPWRLQGGQEALDRGGDATVTLPGEAVVRPAMRVDVGNPHTVLALPDLAALESADLSRPADVDPPPGEGTNVELVVPGPPHQPAGGPSEGQLRMRVYERGVGETRSCGTGAIAAVLATRAWAGAASPRNWWVDVPGGRLRVSVPDDELVAGASVELAGPATIVAEGSLDPDWLREHT